MPSFGTVCDGIGCGHLAFNRAGFECAWSAEIEPFPCAVLVERFPGVVNLGDITADDFIERASKRGHIDALIGGTPCQAFSVAGKREGVNDPRGQLTFRFIEIAEKLKPEYVLWENVPGILSTDDGDCFAFFLDELLRLGYITNCDILDSQFFGVAQRRRRVFVSCQLASILMQQKTITSAITLAQTIGEVSLDILNAHLAASGNAPVFSDVVCANVADGLQRKMRPFETASAEVFRMWLSNSEDVFRNVLQGVGFLESQVGRGTKTAEGSKQTEPDTPLSASGESMENQQKSYSNTFPSLRKCWEDVFAEAKLCIISTPSKQITDEKIWQLFKVVALTAECILPLKDSYQNFSTVGSSFLTTLKEFINYARRTDEPIFTEPWVYGLRCNLVQQAERAAQSLANTRIECYGKVFSIGEGVRRDSPPCRETREGVAGDAGGGVAASLRAQAQCSHRADSETYVPVVRTFDRQSSGEYSSSPLASTVSARDYKSATDLAVLSGGEVSRTLSARHDSSPCVDRGQEIISQSTTVRRLTPIECERLQGLPDGHTLIPWRGKPASECPDGPRYKGIGNGQTVNVMEWLANRIMKGIKTNAV